MRTMIRLRTGLRTHAARARGLWIALAKPNALSPTVPLALPGKTLRAVRGGVGTALGVLHAVGATFLPQCALPIDAVPTAAVILSTAVRRRFAGLIAS